MICIIDTVPQGSSVWSFLKDCTFPKQSRLGIGAGEHAAAAAALRAQRLPNVGYANVSPNQRPMFNHPNNVAHRQRIIAEQEDPALSQGPLSPSEELILAQLPARGKRGHTGPSHQREKTTRQRKQSKRSNSPNTPEEIFEEVVAQAVFPFTEPPIPEGPGLTTQGNPTLIAPRVVTEVSEIQFHGRRV